MTLDQRITEAARHVADGVVVPEVDLDAVRSRARANQRQTCCGGGHGGRGGHRRDGHRRRQRPGRERAGTGGPGRSAAARRAAPDAVLARRRPVRPGCRDRDPVATQPSHRGRRRHGPGGSVRTPRRRSGVGTGRRRPARTGSGPGHVSALSRRRPDRVLVDLPDRGLHARRHLGHRDQPAAGLPRPAGQRRRWRSARLPGGNRRGRDGLLGGRRQRDPGDPLGRPRRHGGADARPEVVRHALSLRGRRGEFFRNQFVSPDGTKEVFTGDAPGPGHDHALPRTELWVRPVGSEDPSDVVRLRVPESRYNQPLYDFETHEGTLGVWWETNETVLVTVHAGVGPHRPHALLDHGRCLRAGVRARCRTTRGSSTGASPTSRPPGNRPATRPTPGRGDSALPTDQNVGVRFPAGAPDFPGKGRQSMTPATRSRAARPGC